MTLKDDLHDVDLFLNRIAADFASLRPILARIQQAGAPTLTRLEVPWLSQLGTDAAYSNSDCGPACVAMWLRYLSIQKTVDDVSRATGLHAGYTYTLPGQLITAASAFGLKLQRLINLSIDDLAERIDAGQPAIALVHYASLSVRYDQKFRAGHWVLACGYDDQGVLYHDPYWPDTTGRFVKSARSDFAKAMADCSIDGNTPNQGLVQA